MARQARGVATRRQAAVEEITRGLGARARPELSWVSRLTRRPPMEVRSALERVGEHSALIKGISKALDRTGRSYYAQFPAPLELYTLVRLTGPKTMVESGVASGISSAFMLLGAADNGAGTLHSIDLPVWRKKGNGNEPWAIPSGLASGWAVPEELRAGWDLRLGRSEDLLKPLLKKVGVLDFYCHDSPVDSGHFEFEMEAIRRHLRPGSVVIADNTDWRVFEQAARSLGAQALRRRGSSLGAFVVPPDGPSHV